MHTRLIFLNMEPIPEMERLRMALTENARLRALVEEINLYKGRVALLEREVLSLHNTIEAKDNAIKEMLHNTGVAMQRMFSRVNK
jgi:hypothetical protein